MPTPYVGCSEKLYLNDTAGLASAGSGTYAAPDWNAIDLAQDVTVSNERTQIDASIRGGGCNRLFVGGLSDTTIEVQVLYDPADTQFNNLRQAYYDETDIDVWAADFTEGVSGTTAAGVRMGCRIFSFSQPQPLDDLTVVNLTLKPSVNTLGTAGAQQNPEWHTETTA
tara:strand:- start:827 stop:1330 length:504 start_codon:yes stop_codon:yes gene_type:complete